ncbi:MAG: hypothetical protein O7H39_07755 [Gammaproteobacteria bacterium]|nr:hypothetical protein [Gammaproteobacteria bacterium]
MAANLVKHQEHSGQITPLSGVSKRLKELQVIMVVTVDPIVMVTIRVGARVVLVLGMAMPVSVRLAVVAVRVCVVSVIGASMRPCARDGSANTVRHNEGRNRAQDGRRTIHAVQYIGSVGSDNHF